MSATHTLYLVCIALVGIINVLPVMGILGSMQLSTAYGIAPPSDTLLLLLRHRALLFGIIGGFVLVSLLRAEYRAPALAMAAASMIGFLVLAATTDGSSEAIRKIVAADLVGLLALGIAAVLHWTR